MVCVYKTNRASVGLKVTLYHPAGSSKRGYFTEKKYIRHGRAILAEVIAFFELRLDVAPDFPVSGNRNSYKSI